MSSIRPLVFGGLLIGLAATAGCQFVPKNKLTAVESRMRALDEQSRAQLAEIANLKNHSRQVENQLMQTERDLANAEERHHIDRQRMVNYDRERDQVDKQFRGLVRGARMPAGFSERLAQLSKRNPLLDYDPETGSCKFDSDVLFDSGDARLKPDAQRILKEFAELFRTADAHDLRVMVVGHTDNRAVARRETRERFPDNWHLSTARALAVADFLQQAGVREDQVGVSGYGRHQPVSSNSTADDRQRNRRVEIFVLSPETPIVGWTESATSLY